MRRRGRVDGPQREIARALRQRGASVAITSNVGDGFPDLVVALQGHLWLVEVKNGALPPSERQLTPAQVEFRRTWQGPPPVTVLSVDDALSLVNVAVRTAGAA